MLFVQISPFIEPFLQKVSKPDPFLFSVFPRPRTHKSALFGSLSRKINEKV